jgi:hypothetical protein
VRRWLPRSRSRRRGAPDERAYKVVADGDSYAPLAGALLFAPSASGGIWAAAHQGRLLRVF